MTAPTPTISTEDTRSQPQLASEINRLQKLIIEDQKTAFERATEIGAMLNRAKHLNGNHGDWLEWLRRSCPDIAETTARLHMRLGKKENAEKLEAAAEANGQRVAHLTVRGAAKLLAKPKKEGGTGTGKGGKGSGKPTTTTTTQAASPDLKDLLQNVGPDELKTALQEARWNV